METGLFFAAGFPADCVNCGMLFPGISDIPVPLLTGDAFGTEVILMVSAGFPAGDADCAGYCADG